MYNKYDVQLNGMEVGQYLTNFTKGYYKLWASNSGRNMAGKNVGTLIGIFPKLNMTFGKMKIATAQPIIDILNDSSASLTYWDDDSEQRKTISVYFGDLELPVKRKGYYESFSCSAIANEKRANNEISI